MGIETAGSLNILFTDKTGTLTKGELEVIGGMFGDGSFFGKESDLFPYSFLYHKFSNALVQNSSCSYDEHKKDWVGGNATDRACVKFLSRKVSVLPKIRVKSFHSKDKYSFVTVKEEGRVTYMKGAPEVLLPRCDSYLNSFGKRVPLLKKDLLLSQMDSYAKKGIRVILVG